jgi:hypothetical protein
MKRILLTLLLFCCLYNANAQTEDYYGPVTISFHGIICNRPTNDDGLGMDGVGDEVSVHFWNWTSVANNRASFNGMSRIYGEDFLLHDRVKAGSATINGGIKAGDIYYREGVYGDSDPNILSKYAIINTFCSQNSLIAILPTIWERDEGTLGVTPIQDFGVATNNAFNDMAIKQKLRNFHTSYTYDDNNPYGYFMAGSNIGLDAKYAGMFTTNKNKLATRPIGLFPNWDFSSQLLVLTPKTIKIIAEKDYGYGKGIIPVTYNEESLGNTFGHGNYILLLRVVADIKLREPPPSPPPFKKYQIGIEVDSVSSGERLEFYIDGLNTVTVTEGKKPFYFPQKLVTSAKFYVRQFGGVRTMEIIPEFYTVGDSDILVKAKRIIPPTQHKIGVKVNAVDVGERFEFSVGANKKITITEANRVAYFPGTFTTGNNYIVTQIFGPRNCLITPNTGQIGHEDVIISTDCGAIPKKVHLPCHFIAPYQTKIVLQNNFSDSLVTFIPNGVTSGLGSAFNNFTKRYPVDSLYSISVKSVSPDLKCTVYSNAEGTVEESPQLICVRCDKTYDLVNRSTDNKILGTYYESFTPVIGGTEKDEGRYLAFGSSVKGMDGSTGKYRQIFWRDRITGKTKLISKSANGEEANGSCHTPAISADGKTVAFESYATNLSGSDNNGARDIYVWQESTGKVSLISKSQTGEAANSESMEPTVSGDGNVIAYSSGAGNITPGVQGISTVNIYVHNLPAGTTELLTKDYETGKGVGGSVPSISEDGTRVAFCSFSYRLTQNDNNNLWDIFLWESSSAKLKRISLTSMGGERNQGTESSSRVVAPSISGNGNLIAYSTTASNIVSGDINGKQDVFVYNVSASSVKRISTAKNGEEGNGDSPINQGEKIGISYDGKWVTYNTAATNFGVLTGNIVLHNTRNGEIIPITNTNGGSTGRPMLSRTGGYVIAGCSEKYDKRFSSSGIFVFYTGK